jgi:DNA-binding HxlR family transcriptional regulator
VRIEYALTDKGRELDQVVEAIQRWANCWEKAAIRA